MGVPVATVGPNIPRLATRMPVAAYMNELKAIAGTDIYLLDQMLKGRISRESLVLDAGCGVGGTSFFLAKNIGCTVHGISITPSQVEQAKHFKKQLDQNNLTSFSCLDYCHTDFPDATFDVVFAVESAMYSTPKDAFLKEAFRILTPLLLDVPKLEP